MEDKMFGYMLNVSLATDACIRAVEKNQNALIMQTKINKRQKFLNCVLLALATLCVSNIGNVIKVIKNQETRIRELEAKLNGEEQKGE